jgi:hypothetical protein
MRKFIYIFLHDDFFSLIGYFIDTKNQFTISSNPIHAK